MKYNSAYQMAQNTKNLYPTHTHFQTTHFKIQDIKYSL